MGEQQPWHSQSPSRMNEIVICGVCVRERSGLLRQP